MFRGLQFKLLASTAPKNQMEIWNTRNIVAGVDARVVEATSSTGTAYGPFSF